MSTSLCAVCQNVSDTYTMILCPEQSKHYIFCHFFLYHKDLCNMNIYIYIYNCFSLRTKETLASGNLLSVINVLMQLRKVCNHPNLFEVRPTVSPFQMEAIEYVTASLVWSALDYDPFKVKYII